MPRKLQAPSQSRHTENERVFAALAMVGGVLGRASWPRRSHSPQCSGKPGRANRALTSPDTPLHWLGSSGLVRANARRGSPCAELAKAGTFADFERGASTVHSLEEISGT